MTDRVQTMRRYDVASQQWGNAHPNSLYNTQINPDPVIRRAYRAWLRQISGDVSSMNRWGREQMSDENRYRR